MSIFDQLYVAKATDGLFFQGRYRPPVRFEHDRWYCVLRLPAGSDGQPVELYEKRNPTRFFEIKACGGVSPSHKQKQAFHLGTGSDIEAQIWMVANLIAEGMLVLR